MEIFLEKKLVFLDVSKTVLVFQKENEVPVVKDRMIRSFPSSQ